MAKAGGTSSKEILPSFLQDTQPLLSRRLELQLTPTPSWSGKHIKTREEARNIMSSWQHSWTASSCISVGFEISNCVAGFGSITVICIWVRPFASTANNTGNNKNKEIHERWVHEYRTWFLLSVLIVLFLKSVRVNAMSQKTWLT